MCASYLGVKVLKLLEEQLRFLCKCLLYSASVMGVH